MIKRLVISILLIACLYVSWALHRQRQLNLIYQNIALGTTESELTGVLGHPWKDSTCGTMFGGSVPNDCVAELLYAAPLAPFTPEYWAYRYDTHGKLIDKYRYASP
jgi:hypothetical protein